jgi:hypothetical protein
MVEMACQASHAAWQADGLATAWEDGGHNIAFPTYIWYRQACHGTGIMAGWVTIALLVQAGW